MEETVLLLDIEQLVTRLHAELGVPEHLARCWITPWGSYYRVVVQRLSDGVCRSGKVEMPTSVSEFA